ncbi:MAG TPA: class I SAM-dependent methyltransferase [Chitinophagaceae bacterium]|nr:class I SAM-dependent methyltransferase [Chitinophagaceae bacterium]
MYSVPQTIFKYLRYYLTASNGKGHGIHSPFVFDFVLKVLNDKTIYPAYRKVETLRTALLNDAAILEVEDLGAGSSAGHSKKRSVQSIAKNAAKPAKLGQLLFRMVQHYQPGALIELGTSLGITSSYLALGNPLGKLITLEGAGSVAQKARDNFDGLKLDNISLVPGNFDDTLPELLRNTREIDFAFIDGNHRLAPTIRYFEQLIEKVHNESILVFDDIHWSREMETAWEAIRQHPSVRCTIDLFFIGIVVFRQEFREKQHFTIRH